MGIIHGIAQSHPVGIIGPVITGNGFFPIWYHIHRFAGPRELGWSDTLYSFLESDGPVQFNVGMCQNPGLERKPSRAGPELGLRAWLKFFISLSRLKRSPSPGLIF